MKEKGPALPMEKNFEKKIEKNQIFLSMSPPGYTYECPPKNLSPFGPAVWTIIRMSYFIIKLLENPNVVFELSKLTEIFCENWLTLISSVWLDVLLVTTD